MKPFLGRFDVRLFFGLLFISVLLLLLPLLRQDACIAVIEYKGTELQRIDLSAVSEPQTLHFTGVCPVELLAEPGAISFSDSACSDRICIRTGTLTKPGQAAVCLPAQISVRLIGKDTATDAVTG